MTSESFIQLRSNLEEYILTAKYILSKYLVKEVKNIAKIQDLELILNELGKNPSVSRMELLRLRVLEISDIYISQNNYEKSEDCFDVAAVIEDTIMLKIWEDPNSSSYLREKAKIYIENYKKEVYEQAFFKLKSNID